MMQLLLSSVLVLLIRGPEGSFGFSLATSQVTPSLPSSCRRRRPTAAHAAGPHLTIARASSLPDLDVIGLVAGQENYGLAVVCVGEALWSFLKSPSFSNVGVLIPGIAVAAVLAGVSGPMITSGDLASVGTGLWIATAASVALGASYVVRLMAPYSESPKEIAALGVVVAAAGLVSFSQNLVVDGFVALPSISLPSLPDINLDLDLGL